MVGDGLVLVGQVVGRVVRFGLGLAGRVLSCWAGPAPKPKNRRLNYMELGRAWFSARLVRGAATLGPMVGHRVGYSKA